MKKLILLLFLLFGFLFYLTYNSKDNISLEDLKKKNEQLLKERGRSKYSESFGPVNSISEINGNWKYSDDLLKIDVPNKTIQFNGSRF